MLKVRIEFFKKSLICTLFSETVCINIYFLHISLYTMTLILVWLAVKLLRKFNCFIGVLYVGYKLHLLAKYAAALIALLKSKILFYIFINVIFALSLHRVESNLYNRNLRI